MLLAFFSLIYYLCAIANITISRYANRSARFIDGYRKGLTGAEAAWANRKYHGHRTLPPDIPHILRGPGIV